MPIFYPAKITKDNEGIYNVEILDLKGCVTFGKTLNDAFKYAKEAIGLYLEDLEIEKYPKPSIPYKNIELKDNEFITLIEFDLEKYLKKNDNRAVKKTLTIPNWLNTIAEEKNINFSQVLQKALKKELNIDL